MRLLLTLTLLLLLLAAPALASKPECMGSDGESWKSVGLDVAMRPSACPDALVLPMGLGELRYELAGPPSVFPHKTVCSWTWVPGSGGSLAPALTAFVCTLHH